MLILSIETTGPVSSVSLINDGHITLKKNSDSYSHLKSLIPMVDSLLKENSVEPSSLSAIAVSQGPGSFTGIRIGVVSAKALAQIWNKPMVMVPSLAVFAFTRFDYVKEGKTLIVPVIDAKMKQVYAAAYRPYSLDAAAEPGVYDINDFLEKLLKVSSGYDQIIFFGDGTVKYEKEINAFPASFKIASPSDFSPSAEGVARIAALLYEQGKTVSCFEAMPDYMRLPEAERKLKEKQAASSGVPNA